MNADEHFNSERQGDRMDRSRGLRCERYEGCRGEGWIYDDTDSGSGRECYCDCAAGEALRKQDIEEGLRMRESTWDRSERRAEALTRADGSERGRR